MRQLYSIQRLKRQKLEQLELMMNETSEFLELVLKEFEYFDDISLSQELNKLTEMVIRIKQFDMIIESPNSFAYALDRFVTKTVKIFYKIENHSKVVLLTLYDEIFRITKSSGSGVYSRQLIQIYELTFPNFLQYGDEIQGKLILLYRQVNGHLDDSFNFYDLRNKLYSVERSIEEIVEGFDTTALKSKKELIQKLRVLNSLYRKVQLLTEVGNIVVFNSLIKTLPIVISCFDDLSEEEKTELLTHCWFLTHFRNHFFFWHNKIEERENVFEIINNIIHFMSHYFSSMSQGSQRELISCYRYQQGLSVRMSMSDEERWKRTKEIIDITLPLLGDIDTETRTIIILLVAQCLRLTQEQEFRDIADEAFIQLSWLTKQYFFEFSDDAICYIIGGIKSYNDRLHEENDIYIIEKVNVLVDFFFSYFECLGANSRAEILNFLFDRIGDIYSKDSSFERYILQRNQISTFILPYFPTLNHQGRASLISRVALYLDASKEMATLDVNLKEQAIKINTKLAITALPYLPQSPEDVQKRIIELFHHTGGLLTTKEKQNEFYKFGISCVTPFNHLLYPNSRNSLINLYHKVAQNASANKDYAKTISICNDAFYLIMPFRDKQVENLRNCDAIFKCYLLCARTFAQRDEHDKAISLLYEAMHLGLYQYHPQTPHIESFIQCVYELLLLKRNNNEYRECSEILENILVIFSGSLPNFSHPTLSWLINCFLSVPNFSRRLELLNALFFHFNTLRKKENLDFSARSNFYSLTETFPQSIPTKRIYYALISGYFKSEKFERYVTSTVSDSENLQQAILQYGQFHRDDFHDFAADICSKKIPMLYDDNDEVKILLSQLSEALIVIDWQKGFSLFVNNVMKNKELLHETKEKQLTVENKEIREIILSARDAILPNLPNEFRASSFAEVTFAFLGNNENIHDIDKRTQIFNQLIMLVIQYLQDREKGATRTNNDLSKKLITLDWQNLWRSALNTGLEHRGLHYIIGCNIDKKLSGKRVLQHWLASYPSTDDFMGLEIWCNQLADYLSTLPWGQLFDQYQRYIVPLSSPKNNSEYTYGFIAFLRAWLSGRMPYWLFQEIASYIKPHLESPHPTTADEWLDELFSILPPALPNLEILQTFEMGNQVLTDKIVESISNEGHATYSVNESSSVLHDLFSQLEKSRIGINLNILNTQSKQDIEPFSQEELDLLYNALSKQVSTAEEYINKHVYFHRKNTNHKDRNEYMEQQDCSKELDPYLVLKTLKNIWINTKKISLVTLKPLTVANKLNSDETLLQLWFDSNNHLNALWLTNTQLQYQQLPNSFSKQQWKIKDKDNSEVLLFDYWRKVHKTTPYDSLLQKSMESLFDSNHSFIIKTWEWLLTHSPLDMEVLTTIYCVGDKHLVTLP